MALMARSISRFNQIGTRLSQVPNDKSVVVFCRVGDWSEQVTEILADRGYDAIQP